MSDKLKRSAKRLVELTGLKYNTAILLIRGDLSFEPLSAQCVIGGGLRRLREHCLFESQVFPVPWPKPTVTVKLCKCEECAKVKYETSTP